MLKVLIGLTMMTLVIEGYFSKGQSVFERKFKECSSTPLCMNRSNDENCIYKCINMECYEELIEKENVLIEFGEITSDLKKNFEKCHGYKTREKSSHSSYKDKGKGKSKGNN